MPITVSRASIGATISRSASSSVFSVPGIATDRASMDVSFTISDRCCSAAVPMIPSPSTMVSSRISDAVTPRATSALNDRPSGSAR